MIINAEVKLDKNKCTNKEYFDKKLNQFTKLVRQSEILEDLRFRRRVAKPSVIKKLKKERARFKWKFYNAK